MNPDYKKRSRLWKLSVGLIGSWIFLSWLLGGRWVRAAEPPKVAPQASEAKPAPRAPVALTAAEIIPRAEQTLRSLQETRFELAADSEAALNALQKEIAAYAEDSDRRWQGETQIINHLRSLQRLNDILREWSLEQSQLDGWDRALSRRSQILVSTEGNVSQIYDTWQATRDAGRQQAYPRVALQKATDVLREADGVRAVIRENMAKLLYLQIQLANRRDALAKIRSAIDRAREVSGRSLFAIDSPPLWQALFSSESRAALVTQAGASARKFSDDLQEFLQKYSDRIILHAISFVALFGLFYFLLRRLAPEEVERRGGSTALFFRDRLFSSALILAGIALPLIYPAATAGVLRIALLPTVIPVISLLPRLLPKIFRPWVYLVVVLYVVDFFRYLLPPDWLLARLLILLTAAAGLVGLGVFLRQQGAQLAAWSSRPRLILFTVRLVAMLFAVSVVSNFVGNVTLAEILLSAPVRSAYLAALIYAGAQFFMMLTAVALQSQAARRLRSVQAHGAWFASRCRTVIRWAGLILWGLVSLNMIGVLSDLTAAGEAFLQLRWKLGAAEISIQGMTIFFAVFLAAVVLSRTVRFVLTEEILPRTRVPRGVPGAVDLLSRYGVLLLGFFIALGAAGVDLSKITLLVSALGVGIGFGLQNVVNNFVSGLILVFEHPVQVGDSIEVGGTTFGEVRKIGFRASVVRTPDGADVIVPNSELIGSRVINWSLFDRLRRISISVSVAYGTDPNRVIDILLEIARKHPAVLAEPAPLAVFDRFADSSLNFTLLCWSSVDSFFIARSELTIAINNAFSEAGIQIPFPQQDVHVHWPGGPGVAAEPSEPLSDVVQSKSAESALLISRKGSLAKK